MEIDISGRHFQVTAALKKSIAGKIAKLDKYSLKLESVHVVLQVQKITYIAEITLLAKSLRLTAKNQGADMRSAFDICFDNIQLQMQRQHDKLKDHKGRRYGVRKKAAEAETEE